MKNSRLFEILYLLLEKRSVTARELSQRLEVSVRTIYRDVDALCAAGIPIYAQRGGGGGIRLMEQFTMDRALLSEREQDEILFALQSLRAAGAVEEESTFERLRTLFRRESTDWLAVDFSDWGSGPKEREVFDTVKEGILAHRRLSFVYYNSEGKRSERIAEPMRLCFKGGNWYLQAWCVKKGAFRTFRLSRMESVTLREEGFSPRAGLPDMLEPQRENSMPPMVLLTLCFSQKAAFRVRDFFRPGDIYPLEDGRLRVTTAFPQGGWVDGFLLSFGGEVEVLSPGWMRERLVQAAKNILQQYQTGQTLSYSMGYPVKEPIKSKEESPMKNHQDFSERKFCQSCGMPLDDPSQRGTDANGAKNEQYCCYCWKDGAFTADMTMEEMIEFNLRFNEENGQPFGTQEEARKMMESWFPTLARWKKQ